MSASAARFNSGSYAAQAAAAPQHPSRPKSTYGLAMEARQQQQRWISHNGDSFSPSAQTTPQRWRGTWESPKSPQTTTTSASPGRAPARTSSVLARPAPKHTAPVQQKGGVSKAKHVEQRVDAEQLSATLDEAASSLLSQLQHVVVQISRQIVEERRHAGQLQGQINSLETVVREQDAMLDQLNRENEALQQEKAHAMKSYQHELRRSVEVRRGAASELHGQVSIRAGPAAATAPISAAAVDRCVCAEFDRWSASTRRDGVPAAASPFDEVSPIVASVLRSLAAQLLQLRQARQLECEVEEAGKQLDRDATLKTVNSPCSSDGAATSSLDAHNAPFSSLSRRPRARELDPSKASPPRTAHHSPPEPAAAKCFAASSKQRRAVESAPQSSAPASSRAHSESSASAENAIYEDAATILSDIRARYGL
ncbi:hypothetical protein NQL31_004088 [Lotmaria passim]